MPTPTSSPTLTLLLLAFAFISCKDKRKNDEKVIAALENSLISSNYTINVSTETLLKDLEEKAQDPLTKERAEIWYSKSKMIANKTKNLHDFLEITKSKKEIDNTDLSFITEKLIQFQVDIFSVDQSIPDILINNFQFINKFIWTTGGDTLQKANKFKSNTSATPVPAILSMLQNEIKKIENRTIVYCRTKVPDPGWWFDVYQVLVGQSSNYLKPGTELQITAAVGVISKASKPIITINNKNIELGPEGFSLYKIKTPKTPGNYRVPVRIKYFNQTIGKEEEYTVDVKYTVVDTCR